MADDAVITLGYDNSKVRAGARETEAVMNAAASKVKRYWNQTSRDVADAFNPLSRGALAKFGGIGVSVFAATSAVRTLHAAVDRLSQADYISPGQKTQLEGMAKGFDLLGESVDRLMSGAITGMASLGSKMAPEAWTGGLNIESLTTAFSAAKQAAAATELNNKLNARRNVLEREFMTDSEKIASLEKESGTASAERKLEIEFEIRKIRQGMTEDEKKARQEKDKADQDRLKWEKDAGERMRKILDDKSKREGDVQRAKEKDEQDAQERAKDSYDKWEQGEFDKIAVMNDFRARRQNVRAEEKAENESRLKEATHIQENLQIMQAKASGNTRLAQRLEKEQGIRTRAAEISEQLGISPASARTIAQRESDLSERAERRANGDRRIYGYTGGARRMTDTLSGYDLYHSRGGTSNMLSPPKGQRVEKGGNAPSKVDNSDVISVLKEIVSRLTVE